MNLDRMVVGFTNTCATSALPITTNVVSSSPTHGKVCSMQHYVIKVVSDLRQVSGFLRVPINLKTFVLIIVLLTTKQTADDL